ncbi:hypothetical protein K431DRAFT_1040 [Polychaeton citri CBS 116435]|uniref:Pre-mRNA-splicing factor rse1 n=1 Tax=Polychaeton citri CBS 116435 TaxID=1314669 RepID=A0A9P4QGZ2_9PEZI|nr:hypothetical protein K431DRAFT_1040 [Polychaeton citri CBS 116435]
MIDQLLIASDSGRITMIGYDAQHNRFKKVHQETFGKSGIRRTIPGQYLANDPRGRCIMIASPEKNKVVYLVQRGSDSEGNIMISSPHEANTWAALCFAVCALDTGWEHPIYAALECDYSDAEGDSTGTAYENREMQLAYYNVDLGLNHVVKSWTDTVDLTSNILFGVPGGQDGPSGVLVCAEGIVQYRHSAYDPLLIPIPRRSGALEDKLRPRIIVSGALHLSRPRHEFFYLLQTEDGDVFKLTMDFEQDAQGRQTLRPTRLRLRYYETYPVAKQMHLIRKGYIYVAAENGDSRLYHVNDLADDPEVEPWNHFTSDDVSPDPNDSYEPTFFHPRGLRYTSLALESSSLHPLMRTMVENPMNEDAPQIYAIQGTADQSAFKTIRHGLQVQEIVSSNLGGVPYDRIWALKQRSSDLYHTYLVLSSSYTDRTIVLEIGDEVETAEDTQFMTNRGTLHVQLMGDTTLVQVHQRGVHSIMENLSINEWPSPSHRTIVAAGGNDRQLLLGLSSSELAFFFMGDDGVLNQLEEMPEMTGKVTAIGVAPTPEGLQQAKWAVVGCDDRTIRVLSIELDSPLEAKSVQALSATPTSLQVVEQIEPESGTRVSYVHIGLQSGLYLRALIDDVTGELGEVRTKFLGARQTQLFPVAVEGQDAVIACSSRPWLGYNHPTSSQFTMTPLVTQQLEAVSNFTSEHLNGLCGIRGSELLIFSVGSLEGRFTEEKIPLQYTPRSFTKNAYQPVFYVAQSEGNTLSQTTREGLMQQAPDGASGATWDIDPEGTGSDLEIGLPRGQGHWASCIQAVDPVDQKTVTSTIELGENEAALCCVAVTFESREWECYLAVGTGQHMRPGESQGPVPMKGFVHIYKLVEDGRKLEFYHKTEFDTPIYALLSYHGRLALGVGNELFLFDVGQKALLRKSRGLAVPNQIVTLQAMGNRIACGDVSESITFVVYKQQHNRMIPFVDDTIQRWTTATTMIDYETVAGGDKFGNLWILRAPEQASKEADEEGLGGYIMNERSYLNGAPYRLELRSSFYVQDIVMSLQRTALVAGGQEVLFWSGLQGTLGILVPFVSRSDMDFFSSLESQLRTEDPPLAGRDHLMYRSYYVPVKGVVDGDLCERFMALSYDSKQKIAAELDREVRDVEKKVQEMRTRVAF